jgi:hypothetical protein
MVGCSQDSPLPTDNEGGFALGQELAAAHQAGNEALAAQLAALREVTARYHSGHEDYPNLFIDVPKTTADGCVSDSTMGGMGFHYSKPNDPATGAPAGIADRTLNYLDPELLVYAPKNGNSVEPGGDAGYSRLAAFDYFVPFAVWDSLDPPPSSADLGLALDPAIPFQWSRFGGWMFHIWPWAHNPAGMFANWNPAVPLCSGSIY